MSRSSKWSRTNRKPKRMPNVYWRRESCQMWCCATGQAAPNVVLCHRASSAKCGAVPQDKQLQMWCCATGQAAANVVLCHRASSCKCSVRTEMPSSSGSRSSGGCASSPTLLWEPEASQMFISLSIYLPLIQQNFQQCTLNTTEWHIDHWMNWKKTWNFVVDMRAFCFVHARSQVSNIASRMH
jgi:hypothetical protein